MIGRGVGAVASAHHDLFDRPAGFLDVGALYPAPVCLRLLAAFCLGVTQGWMAFSLGQPGRWRLSTGPASLGGEMPKVTLPQAANFVSAQQLAQAALEETPTDKPLHSSLIQPQTPGKGTRKRPRPSDVVDTPVAVEPKLAPEPKPKNAKAASATPKAARTSNLLPTLDLLTADAGITKNVDIAVLQHLIESTLEDFNVPVKVVHVESGPTVTQFGVEPLYLERGGQRRKVRVNRIVNLADDLALALAAPAVRIEAPVPGRPYVGIEVPNLEKTKVNLRGILESKVMTKEGGKLTLPIGRNTSGEPVVMDLTRAPHILIAGATGSGKSACINAIITGLLMQHGTGYVALCDGGPKNGRIAWLQWHSTFIGQGYYRGGSGDGRADLVAVADG